jgi:5-formyltetrahydrofolate cyclo-ligase
VYDGPTGLVRARRGLLEPGGPRLGLDAVATADVVLTPGQAVDRTGMRLGQGGGCYDRALGRVPVGTFTCTLLYDDELVDEVPAGPRDRPVTAVVTPSGVTRLQRG